MSTTAPIQGNTFNPAALARNNDGGASLRSGSFRNEQVQLPADPQSALRDAAEEISMHFSEKAEELDHDEREIEAPRHQLVMKAEEVTAYLQAAKLLEGEDRMVQLTKLAEQMLKPGEQSPSRLARQHARDPRDPTERYVLLQFAREFGVARGASAQALAPIDDAIQELEATREGEILAGLNTISDAAAWGKTREEIGSFQQAYRDVALGGATLPETLRIILDRLSGKTGDRFESGLASLMSAVGADLAATRPSVDPARLKTLRSDMDDLTVINTLQQTCRKFVAELLRQTGGAQ